MKSFLNNKICLTLIISQFLSSCTLYMWTPKSSSDKVEEFFIDQENSRVVLIGSQKSQKIDGYYNYSVEEPTKNIVKIFELGQKSGYTSFKTSPEILEIKGSKLHGESITLRVGTNNLSKSEINFLKSKLNENYPGDIKSYPNSVEGNFNITNDMILQYPAAQEQVRNLCSNKDGELDHLNSCIKITKLSIPWENKAKERFTATQKAVRVIATPVTLALDATFLGLFFLWLSSSDDEKHHHHHHK